MVADIVEILTCWYAGWPKAVVADRLGVDRKTVRKYVAPAEAAGITPGGEPVSPEVWAARAREWFPELVTPELRSATFAELARFHEQIKEGLATNTASTVWQRLRDDHGVAASLASFRRYVHVTLPEEAARSAVTVRKDDPPPGEEAQIDYGYLGAWTDPTCDKRRRVWAFVMVLAASRHMFVRPVVAATLAAWIDAHVAAFAFFGGVPARLVCDNLKAGVVKPDLYDPKLNRTYAELAAHYGTLIDPARSRKPKDKPRVERPMAYARDSFFAGRDFASVEDMVDGAVVWCRQVAGRRSHRGLGGAQPLVVFDAVEADALGPLPARAFQLAVWSTPKVAADSHVTVAGALYSVPWRLIGRRVDVRATDALVECFVDGELVKTHARVGKGRRSTDWGDYPPEKVAFLQRTPAWCRHRADQTGPATSELVAGLLAGQALHHLRAAQGVLGLIDRYGPQRLEAACRRATDVGDPSYRTVKGILAAGLETAPTSDPPTDSGAPALLHGPAQLFDPDTAAAAGQAQS
jgi:transposase